MHVSAPEPATAEASDCAGWLDQLASGAQTQDQFVARVLEREADDPEVMWEVLALLDQYYRRKRITRDTFVTLKGRLHRHSLGVRGDAAEPATARIDAARRVPPRVAEAARERAPEPAASAVEEKDDAEPLPLPSMARNAPLVHIPSMHVRDTPTGADAGTNAEAVGRDAAEAGLIEASFHREIRPGDMLCGRYRVVEILRRKDWMSVVEAIDEPKAGMPGIRQRVALQVLDESLSHDPLLLQRVGRLQGLSHPLVTRLLDVDEDNGALVLVHEFFSGASLREVLERRADRRVPLQSARGVVRALAEALAFAHARGIAHGDINAGHVLITDGGDLRLQGFEVRAQGNAVQPAADRLAFARLALELLAGHADAVHARAGSRLRAPPGISRAQWRALRQTLSGEEGNQDSGLLAAFASETAPPLEPIVLAEPARERPARARGYLREWLAAGVVAAIIGAGVYLYLAALEDARQVRPVEAASVEGVAQQAIDPPPVAAVQVGESGSAGAADAGTPVLAAGGPAPATPQQSQQADTGVQDLPPRTAPAATPPPARARVDLASTYAWVETDEPVARIWVRRGGSASREVTFRWWTETGTAIVNRDFRAIEPRVGVIPSGERGVELLVPLMPDPARREPRTFYVKIDEPGPGVDLGTRTLMQVAIVPPGYPAARDTRAAQNITLP